MGFIVSLHVCAELQLAMAAEIKARSHDDRPGAMNAGYPISSWDGVEPKKDEVNKFSHKAVGKLFEWKAVVDATGTLFYSTDEAFHGWDVFVLGTDVEDYPKPAEESFKA